MKKGKIGVQMMMVKPEVEKYGMYEVLKKLHELGFHYVEVSQLAMDDDAVSQMKRACEDFGMEISSLSCGLESFGNTLKGIPMDNLKDNFDKIVSDCKKLNCTIMRIGMMQFSYGDSPEHMLEMAKILDGYAQRLKEHGIDLYYHAHNFEFAKYQGKPLLTHMKDQTKYLGFELDSHWMWRGGVDPVEYLKSFKGRVRMQHLKDYKIVLPDPSILGEHMFGDVEHFAEVGEGMLDMPAIIEAGLESGSEYFMIEQDRTYGRDVYESLTISRDNLIKMGYGDWM